MVAIKKRTRKPITSEGKQLNAVRKLTPTHVVEVELKVNENDRRKLIRKGEHLRIIRNTVLGVLYKNYNQMVRTKEYKRTMKKYIKTINKLELASTSKSKELNKNKKILTDKFEELRNRFNVTFNFGRKYGETLRKFKYNSPDAVTTWSACEMAWDSIEGLLYRGAKKVRFYKKGETVTLQGKQENRCIILKDNYVSFSGMKLLLIVKEGDLFIEETLSNVKSYKESSVLIDKENIKRHTEGRPLISTYRIRNNRIVRKEIRGTDRYFVQIVLEGNPVAKRNKDGTFRHNYGVGRIGSDIGVQSVTFVSKDEVTLKNFAERSKNTFKQERKVNLLKRKQDRSRRAMNPANYDAKGKIKKGPKTWVYSKRYIKTAKELRNLHRIAAENRRYAHNEDINYLRSIGDTLNIEKMNIKALQKKSSEATINKKTGKYNSRKRFGKGILNRSPGYFIARAKLVFKKTGGIVNEVNTWTFKASQYDHVLNDTVKKSLSKRWHELPDKTKLQRDLYSGFLLYCSNDDLQTPNKDLCDKQFKRFKELHDQCIEKIKENRRVVLNSGISLA